MWFCGLFLVPLIFVLVFILWKATYMFLNHADSTAAVYPHPIQHAAVADKLAIQDSDVQGGLSPYPMSPKAKKMSPPKMWLGINASSWFLYSIAIFMGICVVFWCIFNVNTTASARHALGDLAQTAADALASNITRQAMITTSLMTVSNIALEVPPSMQQMPYYYCDGRWDCCLCNWVVATALHLELSGPTCWRQACFKTLYVTESLLCCMILHGSRKIVPHLASATATASATTSNISR